MTTSEIKCAPNITRLNDANIKIGTMKAKAMGRHFAGTNTITDSVAAAVAASLMEMSNYGCIEQHIAKLV